MTVAEVHEGIGDRTVGRHRELAVIGDFVARACTDGDAMFVVGDPGSGKSLLLDYATERASDSAMQVLAARGVEFEAEMAYSGLHQALFPLFSEFDDLSETHRSALNVALGLSDGPAPSSMVVSSAALAALRLAASRQPLLLVVDDLPWIDRPSAVAFGFVARRLAGTHVGFLAAARTNHESFFNHAGLAEVELKPLHRAAAEELIASRFPNLAPSVRAQILEEALGNPLALLELPSTLSEEQRSGMEALPSPLPQSRRLQTLFAARIEALPRGTRRLLLILALDGTGEVRVIEPVDDQGPGMADFEAAERAQLTYISRETRQLKFGHPLIRSTVVELATAEERRWAHEELAKRWVNDPDLQAWHLAEAAIGLDERAAEQLEQLAERKLSRGDVTGAIAALTRSADLSPETTDRGRRFAEAAYIGADIAGALANASRLLAAAREADPRLGGSLQAAVTAALIMVGADGDIEGSHRLLVGAIESWHEAGGGSDGLLDEALRTLLMVCHYGGRPALFEPLNHMLDYFHGDAPLILRVSLDTLGDPVRTAARSLPDLDQLIHDLDKTADSGFLARVGIAAFYVDRLSGCMDACREIVRAARQSGALHDAVSALNLLAYEAYIGGRWNESRELVDEAVAFWSLNGMSTYAWSGRYVQALLSAATGDFDSARAISEAIMRSAVPRRAVSPQWYAWHTRALVALGEGDYDEAFRAASSINQAGSLPSHVCFSLSISRDLVEAAFRAGRHADASAHVGALEEARISEISPRQAMLVSACEAIIAPDEEVLTAFDKALALSDTGRWPFESGRTHLLYGERLRRLRSPTEARTQLTAALEIFETLGARPWASRARSELRATGQSRQRGSHDRAWASLTPQQQEVALLAASGLTNKEIAERLFISSRTVSGHLYRVFPILGISTRAALRDALEDLPDAETVRQVGSALETS